MLNIMMPRKREAVNRMTIGTGVRRALGLASPAGHVHGACGPERAARITGCDQDLTQKLMPNGQRGIDHGAPPGETACRWHVDEGRRRDSIR